MSNAGGRGKVSDKQAGFFDKPWIILTASEWFVTGEIARTEAARRIVWFLATIEKNGDATIIRGIETAELGIERTRLAEHNAALAELGRGDAAAVKEWKERQQQRADTATRKG